MRIFEESNPDWLYMQLHMFKRGLVDAKSLNDDLIFNVRENGIMSLKFENDEQYFKLFDITTDDVWFLNNLFSSYGGLELFDSYRGEEDWNEGYIIHYIDTDNMELMEEIKRIVSPQLDLTESSDVSNFCQLLNELFPKRIDNIVSDYTGEMETAMQDSMSKEIREELCDIFNDDGIHGSDGCFYKYFTTVDALIKLYDKYGQKNSDLITLLTKVGHDKSVDGNYYEDIYEYASNAPFDKDSFNRYLKYQLESIITDMEDDEKFIDVNGYKDTVTYITKKYKMGTWYDLPKDKKIMFKVIRVNPEDNRIELEYKPKGTMDFKKGSVDLEQFNLFLHHPTLF